MKRILLVPFFCTVFLYTFAQTVTKSPAAKSSAADGYSISTTFTPYKNCMFYLGSYFGKNYILIDSARMDAQSHCVIKGNKKLTPGIYFFVSPSRTKLFDFLMDEGQHFSVVADSAHPESVEVTGSAENTIFFDYTKFLNEQGPKLSEIEAKLKNPNLGKANEDSLKVQEAAINKKMNDYRDGIIKNHPESMTALFFKVIKMPDVPKAPLLPNGHVDSGFAYRFTKMHYWDNVAFNDDRLLHTPFFDNPNLPDSKLETYFKYYVSADPDSIYKEANYMLAYAHAGSKEMYHYLLGRFTDKYVNPEIMGQDKVFVLLFENYFLKGDTTWLNAAQKKFIFDRGYSLMVNNIGDAAPALNLVDTTGKPVSLYDIKAPFTFVVFWDPTCSHCKIQVPEVDSIYEAKWKALGLKVFAVNVNEATQDEWKKFIRDNHLNGWYHAWQTKEDHEQESKQGVANFRQLYDVFQTPTMYLLDANKHIIAKRIGVLQFDDFITYKLKQQPSATR